MTEHTPRAARQRHTPILAALTFAGLSYALQQTMVLPALPALREDLNTSTTWVAWVFTGFMLVSAISTPILGKLGDQFGKDRLLVIALSVFVVGCVLATFAWNIWSLIAARAIQGVSGAVFPLAFAIIKDEFPPEKVGKAVGLVSSMFGVGSGVGVVLSGVLVDYVSWRWIFVIGSLVGGAALVIVHRFVPGSPIKTPSRVDVPGAIILSIALASLLLALTEGNDWGWGSPGVVGLFAVGGVALCAWVAVENRVSDPLIDLRMFVLRPVLITNVTAVLMGFSMFGTYLLVPIFLQTPSSAAAYGFGASATLTALYLLPSSLTGFGGGHLAGILGNRRNSKLPLALGLAAASVGTFMLALWHDSAWQILVAMLIWGIGPALSFAAMGKLMVDSVRPTETAVAGATNTVMRTIGGVIGGQAGAAILTAVTIEGTGVPAESAYVIAFSVAAAVAALGAVIALFVTPLRFRSRARAVFQGR